MAGVIKIAKLTKRVVNHLGHYPKLWVVASMIIVATTTSCANSTQVHFSDVSAVNWRTPTTFTFNNSNLEGLHDLDLVLRSNDALRCDTLSILVSIHTPDSLRHEQLLKIPAPKIQPPSARAQQSLFPYLKKIELRSRGEYKVTLTPKTPIRGVEAVGIQIVKSI